MQKQGTMFYKVINFNNVIKYKLIILRELRERVVLFLTRNIYVVVVGRYPCEGQARYASLGALQARIEIGPYNSQTHTLAFFRRHRGRFLPHHYTSPSLLLGLGLGLGLVGGKGAPEARLLEQYKRIPNHTGTNTNPRKLIRKYLEFCWGLPCYGAAFFQGQIERPVRGLASWITNRDLQVLIAINTSGVYIVDDMQCVSKQIFIFHSFFLFHG